MFAPIMHRMPAFTNHRARLSRRFIAAGLALGVLAASGCAQERDFFAGLNLPDTPEPAGEAWPRLADIPEMTGAAAPPAADPAEGARIAQDLTREAAISAAAAETLAGPVLGQGGGAALTARARAQRAEAARASGR